jgi:twinkle protein
LRAGIVRLQAIDSEAREIVITEGEIDAITSWDYGRPALSVPFGGGGGQKQKWIESEFERMARFEVIYLALDMDSDGEAAADEIANRLGRHRCQRVQLPRKDLNECRKAEITTEEIRLCFERARPLDPPELRVLVLLPIALSTWSGQKAIRSRGAYCHSAR